MTKAKKRSITQVGVFVLLLAVLAAIAFVAMPNERVWAKVYPSTGYAYRFGTLEVVVQYEDGTPATPADFSVSKEWTEYQSHVADPKQEEIQNFTGGSLGIDYLDAPMLAFSDEGENEATITLSETTAPSDGYDSKSGSDIVISYIYDNIWNPGDNYRQSMFGDTVYYGLQVSVTSGDAVVTSESIEIVPGESKELKHTLTITYKKPPETQEITLKKTWDDEGNSAGLRPGDIEGFVKYEASAPGQETKTGEVKASGDAWTQNTDNTWTAKLIIPKQIDGMDVSVTDWGETEEPAGYAFEKGDATADTNTYNMTNKFTYGDLTIKKELAVNDTSTSDEFDFTVTLTDSKGSALSNKAFGTDTTDADGTIKFKLKGGGSKTITDLPHGTTYAVEESNMPEGYTVAWTDEDGTAVNGNPGGAIKGADPNSEVIYTATNTRNADEPEMITVKATKAWDDEDDKDGKRVDAVLRILGNGDLVPDVEDQTIAKDATGDDLTVSWDVPKTNDGDEVTYTVVEVDGEEMLEDGATASSGYSVAISGSAADGFTVTNSYTPDPDPEPEPDPDPEPDPEPETVTVTATKVWDDEDDADGLRADAVLRILGNGSAVADAEDQTIAKDATGDDLTVSWTVPETDDDGEELTYTVVEVDGEEVLEDGATASNEYTVAISGSAADGFTVTNSYTPATPTPDPEPDPEPEPDPNPDPDPDPDPDPEPIPDPPVPGTEYTITYKLNGGTFDGSKADIVETYAAGTTIKIHEAPTRDGYTFTHWEGSSYQPGDEYKVIEDHVFTAQWKAKSTPVSKTSTPSTKTSAQTAKTGDASRAALAVLLVVALVSVSGTTFARRRMN